jgi:hypothetical protein
MRHTVGTFKAGGRKNALYGHLLRSEAFANDDKQELTIKVVPHSLLTPRTLHRLPSLVSDLSSFCQRHVVITGLCWRSGMSSLRALVTSWTALERLFVGGVGVFISWCCTVSCTLGSLLVLDYQSHGWACGFTWYTYPEWTLVTNKPALPLFASYIGDCYLLS